MPEIVTRPCPEANTNHLIAEGYQAALARIFAARGIQHRDQLEHGLAKLLPVSGLKQAGEMAVRLADAIAASKRLLVIADYDCDGATACAVAVRGLRLFGASVDFIVPNRFEYGYRWITSSHNVMN